MIHAHVVGGTAAGLRRPFEGRASSWPCYCLGGFSPDDPLVKVNPGHLARCPDCGKRRP